jgi:hypothetical protein
MKTLIRILTGFFLTISITSCDDFGNSKNSLRGVIYTDISEVPQFKNCRVIGGDLLPQYKSFDNKYAVLHISDGVRHIVTFEDVTHKDPGTLAPKHQIIDNLNVDRIEENESFVFSYCQQDATLDQNIIALVKLPKEDAEFTDQVVQAWRIDFESMKIIPISSTKGLKCRLSWPE